MAHGSVCLESKGEVFFRCDSADVKNRAFVAIQAPASAEFLAAMMRTELITVHSARQQIHIPEPEASQVHLQVKTRHQSSAGSIMKTAKVAKNYGLQASKSIMAGI